MSEIIIKKGDVTITAARSSLVEVSETHDGIVFNFKDGLQVYQIDDHMPTHVKQIIANTADKFEKGTLTFDLDNYKTPASVDIT